MATRSKAPPALQATVGSNHATALWALGRKQEAAAAQEEAVELWRSDDDARPESLANQLHNLGVFRFELGDISEAQTHLDAALAIRRQTLGNNHPRAAKILLMLANVAQRRGEQDRALELYDDALAVFARSVGTSHPDYGKALANRGVLKRREGDLRGARSDLTRAVELISATYGEASVHTIRGRNGLALVELDSGNVQGAFDMLEEIVRRAAGTVDDVHLASVHLNLGLVSRRLELPERAREEYVRGLALAEQASNPRHIADAELGLAALDKAQGREASATAHAERAREALEGLDAPVSPDLQAQLDAFLPK